MKNKVILLFLLLCILLVSFSNVVTASMNWFSDVSIENKYFNSILRITDLKIMNVENRKFNPEQVVTKAELADALTKLMDQVEQEQKIINTIANTLSSVVRIEGSTTTHYPAEDGYPERWMTDNIISMGTGAFVGDNIILTNAHVVYGRNEFTVETSNGEKYKAELIKSDDYLDLALLKLKTDKTFTHISFSNKVEQGQTSIVIGHTAADNGLTLLNWNVTKGVVSKTRAEVTWFKDRLIIDNPINSGNSGAPVIDINGKMIGLVVASANDKDRVGYVIRIEDIKEFINKEVK